MQHCKYCGWAALSWTISSVRTIIISKTFRKWFFFKKTVPIKEEHKMSFHSCSHKVCRMMASSDAEKWGRKVSSEGYQLKMIKDMSEENILKIRKDYIELMDRIKSYDDTTDNETGKIPKILYSWDHEWIAPEDRNFQQIKGKNE